jgi:phosphate:Na+ symporter
LRLADLLEAMLTGLAEGLTQGDRRRIAEARRVEEALDRLNAAIRAYLAGFDPEILTEADRARVGEILAFATNLEHAGDVVDRNLLVLVGRTLKRGWPLTAPQIANLVGAIARVTANLRSAASLFVSADTRAARLLVEEKQAFREMENEATAAHFEAIRAGDPEEASTLHLDLLRDLRRVNAHLVAASAYPVLERDGALLPSRLRQDD